MTDAILLRAQRSYSTDPRYHEAMAHKVEARGRLLVAFAVGCLALAAARAADLGFFQGLMLSDSLAIMQGHGVAPDQYRYLPHLIMVGLAQAIGFKAALEVFTFAPLLACFCMMMFVAWQDRPALERGAACIFVALIYPLSMFAGARFDTGLMMTFMLGGLCLWRRPLLYLPLVLLFSLARADYALILVLFVLVQAHESREPIESYLLACALPIGAQLMMWRAFPDATYYTEIVQLFANMNGDFLRSPGFLYTAGAAVLLVAYAGRTIRIDRHMAAKLAVLALYVGMVFVFARAREWRLWLPLLPLVYGLLFGPALTGARQNQSRASRAGRTG